MSFPLIGLFFLESSILSVTKLLVLNHLGQKLLDKKLKYAVDVKLRATHTTPVMVGEIQVAQEVHWKIESSAIGRPGTCTSILRYGYGIDKEAELVQLASEAGVIPKGGSWYTLPSGEKLQGLENIRNVLVEKPEIYQEINKKFRELLRLDG